MNKFKIIITLFMGLSLFFINPISANIINGDFEDGLMGWDINYTTVGGVPMYASNPGSDSYHNSAYLHAGMYGVNTGQWGKVIVSQYVDITGYLNITCNSNGYQRGGYYHRLYVGDLYVPIYGNSAAPNFAPFTLDISSLTGMQKVSIVVYGSEYSSGSGYSYIRFDDVQLSGIIPSSLSFYPTLTNITPTHINYTVGALDETNDYFILTARIVDDETYWLDYIWLDDIEIGSPVLNFMDYGSNCTYYAELHNSGSGNMIVNISQEFIFNVNDTPEFPDPDPTPDITPLPTYTPPPTPIPPDNPITPNNTLNTSWYQGYISLVDSCINGLFNPIYNATAYFMYPTIVLTTTGANLMIESEIIFAVVTEKILIATSMMEVFFNCLPDKLIYVMIYYLLWLVILLVFKGAA